MAEGQSRVYLFGDQTGDFDAGLRRLLHAKNNSLVTAFFHRCFHAMRQEITKLPPSQRQHFPRFTCILDLLARYRESGINPALESALTCIYELGCFINYYGDLGHAYPSGSNSIIIGLCTGLLPSAAVSCSKTVGELIPVAVETVVLALRLGLCVNSVRQLVDTGRSSSTSWSVLASGIGGDNAMEKIREFSNEQTIPPSSQPYISAVSANGVTISAPPTTLDQFQASLSKDRKHTRAPIHGPYHAAHLYDAPDVERILSFWQKDFFSNYTPHIPVLSNNTGKPIEAETIDALLKTSLEEVLMHQLCWDRVTESCASILKSTDNSACTLIPISSSATQSLHTSLKKSDIPTITVNSAAGEISNNPSTINTTGRSEHSKIAIIGYSGRFPEAEDLEKFWDLLYKGLDVHREVPPDRWDVKTHVDPTGKTRNTSKIPYGCWINEPGLFDPRFFNMSPREALQADPAQRIALLTAYEALEMAGFVPDSTPSTQKNRVGIFYGMTSDDYREINSGQDIDTYFIPGGNRAFTPGRINYFFKFSGPSVSVDTACSSSLAAIHMACNSIWRNDCDSALAGGVNVLTNPDNHAGLDRGHFLSTTGNCNTFDDGADGYCRADGVGTVILKRLEDAQADSDPIFGIINGAYTNHSAESVSITRPHSGAQAFIFDKLLNECNVDPKEISYIEMHGTGTQAGDAVEMESVLDTFAPDYRRGPTQSLHLGSTKANIGHGESASGVCALVKVLLMMKKNMIPPHCGIKTKINHNFPTDLQQRNVHIAFQPTLWNRPQSGKRKVFVNNFSAAGGNTALLVEDGYLPSQEDVQDPRNVHIVTVSARSQSALKNNINDLVKYIYTCAKSFDVKESNLLANLSYTTTARRFHHPFRAVSSGSTLKEVSEALTASGRRDNITPVPATTPNAGFVFTGQGAQYTGMGKQLYESNSEFRTAIQHYDCIAQSQGFPSILSLVDGSIQVEELSPVVVQLGTTCVQMALANYWISLGIEPAFVIGHSLGDYAALNIAGVLTPSDTIYLCGCRAQLLMEQCKVETHAMLAVKAPLLQLKGLMNASVHETSCVNGPAETVISGLGADIDDLAQKLSSESIKSTKLRVPFAFHSSQVRPILESFEETAQGVTFNKPTIPFVSPLLGEVISEANAGVLDAKYLARHCRETVNFLGALEATRHANLMNDKTVWIEIGSHTICSGMVKATFGPQTTTVASLRREENTWKVLANSLSTVYMTGIDLHWREYHQSFSSRHQVLPLPAYNWDLKNYWIPYTGDFCLTKGSTPAAGAIETAPVSTYLTTAAQKIVETRDEGATATVVVQNSVTDSELDRVIQGHKVNGASLCPSSLYADIAQTLGEYLIEKYKPELKGTGLDVSDVAITRPLIAKTGEELFRVAATANWAEKHAKILIYSVNLEGKKTVEHGTLSVKFFDLGAIQLEWKRHAYLIKRSIDRLQESAETGGAHRMKRGMVYKLFAALVDYDDNFRSIREVILDSEENEATACVKFQAPPGNFHRNPFWIDSFGHLSGFIMNANDTTDSKNLVFVNHGWDSMRCARKFSPDVTYRTYVRMQPWQGTIWAGDVWIFDGDDVVAVFGAVKFQALARKILDTVLPPAGAANKPSKPAAQRTPAPVQKSSAGVAKKTQPAPAKSTRPSLVTRALSILASEVGMSESEMSDDLVFADYGVDSLLSLTVTGRYREELDLDLDSSVFIDQPTVKDFKKLVAQTTPAASADASDGTRSESEFGSSDHGDSSSTDVSSAGSPGLISPPNEKVSQVEMTDRLKEIKSILMEEIGVSEDELTPEANLPDMGMDSLLSLTVLGRIREELDIDLPSEFFIENQTLDVIATVLNLKPKQGPAPAAPIKLSESMQPAAPTTTTTEIQHPPATSILLQGNPKTATSTIFLFPDGSGSATSYATLPPLSPTICIYGLNCPYMKTPEKLKYPLAEITKPYLREVRRRQPHGPYNFGGWSAGGICAYDAAWQLILEEGETVERLFLLDSPFPIGLEKLPPRLYSFFDNIGLFGKGRTPPPKWLLPHFLAFIDSLDAYRAAPFPTSDPNKKPPKTFLVWAKDGVCNTLDHPRPAPAEDGSPDPREMTWLLENRTDLGPNKWDTLVGKENVGGIQVIGRANHFNMVRGEAGGVLAGFMRGAMQG